MTFHFKYLLFTLVCLGSFGSLFSQNENQVRQSLKTAGMVAYYFWEEDSCGNILSNDISQPFLQNYSILRFPSYAGKREPKQKHLQSLIAEFAHDDIHTRKRKNFKLEQSDSVYKNQTFELQKRAFKKIETVNYVFKNGKWTSLRRHAVNYFIKQPDGRIKFYYSSDSISLFQRQFAQRANAHYSVYLYRDSNNQTIQYQVFNYAGKDVTSQFSDSMNTAPMRTLVFANGYRGPKKEKDQSDGLITQDDRYHYWYKIDNQFIDQLKPNTTFYMDGSFSIKTSNHKNKVKFAWSYLRTSLSRKKARSKRSYKALNSKNNETGFYERFEQGKRAGVVFLLAKCNEPNCLNVKDTVDIVCHSMGYAYSLGFIETIKDHVVFGKIYIIAPEGASVACADWSLFQEVWQYGSNLGEQNQDPLHEQDGITPQQAVKNIDKVTKGGRVFIPANWPTKNFVESHMIYSYQWIFDRIKPGEPGFVVK